MIIMPHVKYGGGKILSKIPKAIGLVKCTKNVHLIIYTYDYCLNE